MSDGMLTIGEQFTDEECKAARVQAGIRPWHATIRFERELGAGERYDFRHRAMVLFKGRSVVFEKEGAHFLFFGGQEAVMSAEDFVDEKTPKQGLLYFSTLQPGLNDELSLQVQNRSREARRVVFEVRGMALK